MTNEIMRRAETDIVREGPFDFTPRSLSEAIRLAELMAQSELVPKQFQGKPGDILICVQFGQEVGLRPMQALQGIAIINGRPTIWGDAALGIVLNSGLMENYKEMTLEEIEAAGKAVFWAKRKGVAEPIIREFSLEHARKAKLLSKSGPWQEYPYRMLQMRARAWGLRDGFADVLKGIAIREEVEDIMEPVEAPKVLAMPKRKSAAPPPAESEAQSAPAGNSHDADREGRNQPAQPEPAAPVCEICGRAMKLVPAGRTKPSEKYPDGREYPAFWACPDGGPGKKHEACTIKDSDWQAQKGQTREPGQEG